MNRRYRAFVKTAPLSVLLLLACLLPAAAETGESPHRNIVTLSPIPVIIPIAAGGLGVGMGYERRHTAWLSSRYELATGFAKPRGNGGTMVYLEANAGVRFFPLKTAPEGLVLGTQVNLVYVAARGESIYNGLEAHYILPQLKFSAGWRFIFGKNPENKNRPAFLLAPGLGYTLTFPGTSFSGPGGRLQKRGTGLWFGTLMPVLNLGITF